jgi:hypothetical protein
MASDHDKLMDTAKRFGDSMEEAARNVDAGLDALRGVPAPPPPPPPATPPDDSPGQPGGITININNR